MHCHLHNDFVAVAVCSNCGRGLCAECITGQEGVVIVCGEHCRTQSTETRHALTMVAKKTLRTSLVTAWLCWLMGGGFLLLGLMAMASAQWFLVIMCGGMGTVFIVAGFWYWRVSQRDA